MAEAQQRFADALKFVAEARAAPPPQFQDLAGDALMKLRRGILACDAHASDALLGVPVAEMLAVFDFLLKCSLRKARKAQVVECLGFLLRRTSWARAAASSPEAHSSLTTFLEGHQQLLDILNTPMQELDTKRENQADNFGAHLSQAQKESLGNYLSNGREAMRSSGWVYQTGLHSEEASDKAVVGFRNFYRGVAQMDAANPSATGAEAVLGALQSDWPDILRFLASLYEARKTSRVQVAYVVEKLAAFSPSFCAALEAQTELPWRRCEVQG
jgi:hypothetical protein